MNTTEAKRDPFFEALITRTILTRPLLLAEARRRLGAVIAVADPENDPFIRDEIESMLRIGTERILAELGLTDPNVPRVMGGSVPPSAAD